MNLDWSILHGLRALTTCPLLDFWMPKITALGNSGIIWVLAAVALLCTKKYRRYGVMLLVGLAAALLLGNLALKRILRAEFEEGTSEVIEQALLQLDEFFAGKRREFDVPLLFVGTDFQKTVWNELLKIPFGKTISYGEMAQRIGLPKAVRAVANANGANSMSIFAPCHRVIGSDRSLTGYGGGLAAKQMLLELEGVL